MSSSVNAFNELVGGADSCGFQITSDIVKAAMEAEKKDRVERASEALKGVFTVANAEITNAVAELRRIREMEKTAKEKVDSLNDGVKFFAETGNPFPLYAARGLGPNSHDVAIMCSKMGIAIPKKDNPVWKTE